MPFSFISSYIEIPLIPIFCNNSHWSPLHFGRRPPSFHQTVDTFHYITDHWSAHHHLHLRPASDLPSNFIFWILFSFVILLPTFIFVHRQFFSTKVGLHVRNVKLGFFAKTNTLVFYSFFARVLSIFLLISREFKGNRIKLAPNVQRIQHWWTRLFEESRSLAVLLVKCRPPQSQVGSASGSLCQKFPVIHSFICGRNTMNPLKQLNHRCLNRKWRIIEAAAWKSRVYQERWESMRVTASEWQHGKRTRTTRQSRTCGPWHDQSIFLPFNVMIFYTQQTILLCRQPCSISDLVRPI